MPIREIAGEQQHVHATSLARVYLGLAGAALLCALFLLHAFSEREARLEQARMSQYADLLVFPVWNYDSEKTSAIFRIINSNGQYLSATAEDQSQIAIGEFSATRENEFISIPAVHFSKTFQEKIFFNGEHIGTLHATRVFDHRTVASLILLFCILLAMIAGAMINIQRVRQSLAGTLGLMKKEYDLRLESEKRLEAQFYARNAQLELQKIIREQDDISALCNAALSFLCEFCSASVGAIYACKEEGDGAAVLAGCYAMTREDVRIRKLSSANGGLVGQVLAQRKAIRIDKLPEDYLVISTATGCLGSAEVLILPAIYNGRLTAIIELGTLGKFSVEQQEFVQTSSENVAAAVLSMIDQIDFSVKQDTAEETEA